MKKCISISPLYTTYFWQRISLYFIEITACFKYITQTKFYKKMVRLSTNHGPQPKSWWGILPRCIFHEKMDRFYWKMARLLNTRTIFYGKWSVFKYSTRRKFYQKNGPFKYLENILPKHGMRTKSWGWILPRSILYQKNEPFLNTRRTFHRKMVQIFIW